MRIKKIETFCDPFVGFVRVTAEDGAQGWGQVSTYHADISCLILQIHSQIEGTYILRCFSSSPCDICFVELNEFDLCRLFLSTHNS